MQEIHPEYRPVIFKDGEHEIVTRSTATSDQTREVDGVEHHVINVDISAFTHPFYTGQQTLVDTEGRVDRFKKRYNLEDDDEESSGEAEASDEEEQDVSDEVEATDDEDASEDVETSEDEESSDDEE